MAYPLKFGGVLSQGFWGISSRVQRTCLSGDTFDMSDDEQEISENAAETQNKQMDIANVNEKEETEQQAQQRMEEEELIEKEAQELFEQQQVALLKEAEKVKHQRAVQERVAQLMRSQEGNGSQPHIQPPSQQQVTPFKGVSGNYNFTPNSQLQPINFNKDPFPSIGGKDNDESGTTRVDSGTNIYLIFI